MFDLARGIVLVLVLCLSLRLRAQEAPLLHLYCDAASSRVALAMTPLSDAGKLEHVEISKLVTHSPEDKRGNVLRKGSSSITRPCGQLSVNISGGYFNANPQGELGAADDYPLVEVFAGDRKLAGPLAIGECTPSIARYSVFAACPVDWASQVRVNLSGDRTVVLLRHEYEEVRQTPSRKEPSASDP